MGLLEYRTENKWMLELTAKKKKKIGKEKLQQMQLLGHFEVLDPRVRTGLKPLCYCGKQS